MSDTRDYEQSIRQRITELRTQGTELRQRGAALEAQAAELEARLPPVTQLRPKLTLIRGSKTALALAAVVPHLKPPVHKTASTVHKAASVAYIHKVAAATTLMAGAAVIAVPMIFASPIPTTTPQTVVASPDVPVSRPAQRLRPGITTPGQPTPTRLRRPTSAPTSPPSFLTAPTATPIIGGELATPPSPVGKGKMKKRRHMPTAPATSTKPTPTPPPSTSPPAPHRRHHEQSGCLDALVLEVCG